jgi:hypothetical protein
MTILDHLSQSPLVPGPLRFLVQEICLQSELSGHLREADDVVRLGNERRPRCVTRYTLRRLSSYLGDAGKHRAKLIDSAQRRSLASYGRKRFDMRAEALRATIGSIREVCQQDEAYEQESRELRADRDRLAREAAPLLVGGTEGEFRGYEGQFHKKFSAFPACSDLAGVNQCLNDLREAAAAMDRIVEKTKRVEQELHIANDAFDKIDRRAISADPWSDEVYVRTAVILESLGGGKGRGEVERSVALLSKVNQNLDTLALQANHVQRDAASEVELWHRIALFCPRVTSPFAIELANFPQEPSGDSLSAWSILKRAIENSVNQAAHDTRLGNAMALHNHMFSYEWGDPKPRRLRAFVKHSYRALQEIASQPGD